MKGNLCSMGITYTIWRSREQGRFEIKKKKKKKKKERKKRGLFPQRLGPHIRGVSTWVQKAGDG
jgi:hypothetical protein